MSPSRRRQAVLMLPCLSTIEHVGLGRYGDPIDPWGDIKMAANLRRLLRSGGIMLPSFPVGRSAVVYNGHRIYSRRRRKMLFGEAEVAVDEPAASSQPIYVLEKPARV